MRIRISFVSSRVFSYVCQTFVRRKQVVSSHVRISDGHVSVRPKILESDMGGKGPNEKVVNVSSVRGRANERDYITVAINSNCVTINTFWI